MLKIAVYRSMALIMAGMGNWVLIFQVLNFPNFYIYLGERWQYVKVSKTWEDSGEVTQEMGAVGYIFSGGTYFDARSDPDGASAIYNEGTTLDPYYGHSNQDLQYHYHAVSSFEYL